MALTDNQICSEWCTATNCTATIKMLDKASDEGINTMFHRVQTSKPCPIGSQGLCCTVCTMGPCRVSDNSKNPTVGICGSTAATIAARNFGRMIAAGTAAHSDHGREIAEFLLAVGQGEVSTHEIKDEEKLLKVASIYEIDTKNKEKNEIAVELAEKVLSDFGKQHGELTFTKRAPEKRKALWRKLNIVPRGIDREIAEMLHRTSVGVDSDYKNILLHGCRTSLADGWGGAMIATELQDILFGTPYPIRSKVNLGVLKEDEVNIIVHGHDPLVADSVVTAANDPELIELAKKHGAKGINVSGICCTANEILMRRGVPIAGNYVQQELAIVTGAVEAMVVDVQCLNQSLPDVAKCYHTELITTSSKAKIIGATHIEFEPHNVLQSSKELVKRAILNFPKRGKVDIPKETLDFVAGFSHEAIEYILGGKFRSGYSPLNANIINGKIRGLAGIAGCNHPRLRTGYLHGVLMRELIANNVLVVAAGCAAITAAKEGLMVPEAAELAGSGLREICEAVGIPPVLHVGACVDNSRILISLTNIIHEGGLGEDISQIPVVGCAPEWMSEKAIAIGHFYVSSGLMVVFGNTFPVTGSEDVSNFLFNEIEELTGGKWAYEQDPLEMARLMIERIDEKRKALGIDKEKERVLFDMKMRRELCASV